MVFLLSTLNRYKKKERKCTNPKPMYGGNFCSGKAMEMEICPPVNGQWSSWQYSTDSYCQFNKENEKWMKPKYRNCTGLFGGLCLPDPKTNETDSGYTVCEPINGKWSSWKLIDKNCSLNMAGNKIQ